MIKAKHYPKGVTERCAGVCLIDSNVFVAHSG